MKVLSLRCSLLWGGQTKQKKNANGPFVTPNGYLKTLFRSMWLLQKIKYPWFHICFQKPPVFLEFLLRISDIPAIILRHHNFGWQRIDTYHVRNNWPLGISLCFLLGFSSHETIPLLVLIYSYDHISFPRNIIFKIMKRIKMVTGSHSHDYATSLFLNLNWCSVSSALLYWQRKPCTF